MPWRVKECGRRGATGACSVCMLIWTLNLGCAGRSHRLAEPLDRGIDAAPAVRDLQRSKCNFDNAERTEDHRGVDMAHMGDAERFAREVAAAGAQHHAAMLLAIA